MTVIYMYIYKYMYACVCVCVCVYIYIYIYIDIYICWEWGLGSEKIWGVTVDKWEGKIGAKFLSKVQMALRKLR